jgi:hypothetical protein
MYNKYINALKISAAKYIQCTAMAVVVHEYETTP